MSTAEAAQGGAPLTQSGGTHSGLFTRQASGLVREIGIPAAVGISIGAVAAANMLIAFPIGMTAFAKADFYMPLVIGGIVWVMAMLAYRHLVVAMPRAGGEYMYVSRILSPVAGAMAGIGTALVLIYTLAANVHVAAVFAPFMMESLGSAFNSSALTEAAGHITSNLAVLLISLGIMVAVGLMGLLSLKRLAQILIAMIVVQLLAFIFLAALLAFHSHADFVHAFARYSKHPGAYQHLIALGKSNGVAYGVGIAAAAGLVPLLVLAYSGVLYSNYVGGELRRPGRTFLYASAISIGLLFLAWAGIWALMRGTAGLHFMQAQANLSAGDPTAYGKVTTLNSEIGPFGYGLMLAGDPISKILFGLAVPVASVGVAIAFVAVITRVLFALAFDRMLPVGVAKVTERTHTPIVAIGIVVVIGAGFCALLTYANLTNIFGLLSLFLALVLFSGALAATFLAHRRPDLVLKPGETEVSRWLGIPRSTWAGGITTALVLFTIVELLLHQEAYGKLNAESITTLAVVLLAGPIIYLIARGLRRQRNQLDLSMAMHDLPPE